MSAIVVGEEFMRFKINDDAQQKEEGDGAGSESERPLHSGASKNVLKSKNTLITGESTLKPSIPDQDDASLDSIDPELLDQLRKQSPRDHAIFSEFKVEKPKPVYVG